MKNLVLHREGEASYISYIKKRIKNNLNFISLIQGPTGSGKTWSAISISQSLDPTFDSRQICFDFKEVMTLINSDWFKEKKIKVIIFDEPQISISNRAWQSMTNKLMNYLLSTFRHQNIVLFFCSPYKDFLDSQSMKLLHCLFECVNINKKNKTCRLKPLLQQYNSNMKKMYQHKLYTIKNSKVEGVSFWDVNKPSQDIIDVYETNKTNFTFKLNNTIESKLDELIKKEAPKPEIDTRKPLTIKQERAMSLLSKFKGGEVAEKLGVDQSAVSRRKQLAEKKGYKVSEWLGNPTFEVV